MILLKSEQRTAAEIADLLGCCEVVVNNWLKRYESEGIEGLRTRPGRGRKPVLNAEQDLPSVKAAVAANRQRISLAKVELEVELGKTLSTKTLERYLKKVIIYLTDPMIEAILSLLLKLQGRTAFDGTHHQIQEPRGTYQLLPR